MTSEEFLLASLSRLESLTGIDRHRWSRYINGRVAINERTLSRAADALEMTPIGLLDAIRVRRSRVSDRSA